MNDSLSHALAEIRREIHANPVTPSRTLRFTPPANMAAHGTDAPASMTTPAKATRSLSDSGAAPRLSPSPTFKESGSAIRTQDDQLIIGTPSRLPRRSSLAQAHGLILQLPPRDPNLTFGEPRPRKQRTPEFEQRESYGSPSSVLPRHSRGLDFSRACTNLHHSTLADRASPASSPTMTQRGINIPSRRTSTLLLDNPRPSGLWGGLGEKGFYPRSFGSATALTSDASSSDSDDDDDPMSRGEDPDDPMVGTPLIRRAEGTAVTPFGAPRSSISRGRKAASPMHFHPTAGRARPRGHVASASLSTRMGYFGFEDRMPSAGQDVDMSSPASRRESLSFGANNLRITTTNESSDEQSMPAPSTPGVVRRPVMRRSNLLPKSKGFARIRAALQEETQPIDSEAAREAEIVRQVRVKDVGSRSQPADASVASSPRLGPQAAPRPSTDPSDRMSDVDMASDAPDRRPPDGERTFSSKEFWPHLYNSSRATPPPPLFHRARSSSNMSEDIAPGLDPDALSTRGGTSISTDPADIKPTTEATTPALPAPAMPTAADITRKINNKRRRDDDFDPASIKRRAVSPGMSVHSSPVTGQSPISNSGAWQGGSQLATKPHRESTGGASTSADERAPSVGGLTPHLGPKRVGFQGMTDTNDGLMKMSIE